MKLEKKSQKDIKIPLDSRRFIFAATDVANDYFSRADNIGSLSFSNDKIKKYFRTSQNLKDGRFTVSFSPQSETGIDVGIRFSFTLRLQDSAMPQEVATDSVTIIITKKINLNKNKSKKSKKSKKPTVGIPKYKLLTKDGRKVNGDKTEKWPKSFDNYDGGDVVDFG